MNSVLIKVHEQLFSSLFMLLLRLFYNNLASNVGFNLYGFNAEGISAVLTVFENRLALLHPKAYRNKLANNANSDVVLPSIKSVKPLCPTTFTPLNGAVAVFSRILLSPKYLFQAP